MNTPPDAPNAIEVVEHYQLETLLPHSIMKAIRTAVRTSQEEGLGPAPPAHIVLLDNGTALEAAHSKALALGFTSAILNDISEQPIETGCDLLLSRLLAEPPSDPFCLISGGNELDLIRSSFCSTVNCSVLMTGPASGSGAGPSGWHPTRESAVKAHAITKSERFSMFLNEKAPGGFHRRDPFFD